MFLGLWYFFHHSCFFLGDCDFEYRAVFTAFRGFSRFMLCNNGIGYQEREIRLNWLVDVLPENDIRLRKRSDLSYSFHKIDWRASLSQSHQKIKSHPIPWYSPVHTFVLDCPVTRLFNLLVVAFSSVLEL